jgi:hypothetical protein
MNMGHANKCDRCGVLYVQKPGDLDIFGLNENCTAPKGSKESGRWSQAIYDEDEPYEMCTACSGLLREFLALPPPDSDAPKSRRHADAQRVRPDRKDL